VVTQTDLALLLLREGQAEEGEQLVAAALEGTRTLAPGAAARILALTQAAEFFQKSGQPERSAELRAQLVSGSSGDQPASSLRASSQPGAGKPK
jgi:hypothetical protein